VNKVTKGIKKVNVLVTGIGGGGHGEQVLKALRMAATPYHIIGTDMSQTSMGLYAVDKSYIVPPASDSTYIPKLLDICKKENVVVLITGSEPELIKVSENRREFERQGVLILINTPEVLDICMDKWKTYNFLNGNGFDCPRSVLVGEDTNLDKLIISDKITLPIIIKPAVASGGSANVFLAQDQEELIFFVKYLKKQGLKPLVQEYIGSHEEEYTVGVLTDIRSGDLIGSIAIKRQILSGLSNKIKIKNRYFARIKSSILTVSSGVSQGIIDDFPEVRRYCENIALKLSSKGPLNIQCRKEGEKIYAFEINPRFSGTTSLRAMVGYNEPDILIRKYILGENTKTVEYKKGMIVRGLSEQYIPTEKLTRNS
jgi:carbamoyl-phosphate synthase large subunit